MAVGEHAARPLPGTRRRAVSTRTRKPHGHPDRLEITGGTPLAGSVHVGGSITGARTLIAAAAALRRTLLIEGVPRCAPVCADLDVLTRCGWQVRWQTHDATTRLAVTPGSVGDPPDLLRTGAGIHLAPALLRAYRHVLLPWPEAPREREALHECLLVHKALGNEVTEHEHGYALTAGEAPENAEITLDRRSTPATLTALIAAASTRTALTLRDPAFSAEAGLLWASLRAAGFDGAVTEPVLRIAPGWRRPGCGRWGNFGDRFEAALYACALAATRGRGLVTGVGATPEFTSLSAQIERTGAVIDHQRLDLHVISISGNPGCAWDGIRVRAGCDPRDLEPCFTPLLAALALHAAGRHRLEDRTDPDRTDRLAAMFAQLGAEIAPTRDSQVIFTGPRSLHPGRIEAEDIETAAAGLIAALAVHGTSVLTGAAPLLAAYPRMLENLANLNARIRPRPSGRGISLQPADPPAGPAAPARDARRGR